MPTAYRVEIAPNARAGCQNSECKKEGVKLLKGEIRFGTWVEIPGLDGHASWKWRHWGCTTPQVLENLQASTGGDTDLIDGFEEVPADVQQKIVRALEQGHVDDSEWKGDVEVNRPGRKGFRMTKAEQRQKEKDAEKAAEDGPPPTSTPKKRGRGKKVADDDDEIETGAPAAKKQRGRPQKAATEDEDLIKEPKAVKKRGTKPKKATVEDEETQNPAPSAKKGAAKLKNESVDDGESTKNTIAAKKKGGGQKKSKPDNVENGNFEDVGAVEEKSISSPINSKVSKKGSTAKGKKRKAVKDE